MRYAKILFGASALLAASVLIGCSLGGNSAYAPAAAPTLANGAPIQAQTDSLKTGRTIININSTQNAAPLPNTAVIQTGYQTVYTTEYGPMGPVVKKAMIPVYSAAPAPLNAPVSLMPVPNAAGEMSGAPIILQQNIMPQPVVGYPPAQPMLPAISEPSAWFGPVSSPNAYYSQQTRWY